MVIVCFLTWRWSFTRFSIKTWASAKYGSINTIYNLSNCCTGSRAVVCYGFLLISIFVYCWFYCECYHKERLSVYLSYHLGFSLNRRLNCYTGSAFPLVPVVDRAVPRVIFEQTTKLRQSAFDDRLFSSRVVYRKINKTLWSSWSQAQLVSLALLCVGWERQKIK